MFVINRDIHLLGHIDADLAPQMEKGARAVLLAVRIIGAELAIMEGAAEKGREPEMPDRPAIEGVEAPGQPGIGEARRAGRIDRDAEMRARREDRREEIGRCKEEFGIDVAA